MVAAATNGHANGNGAAPPRGITMEEVAQHTGEDSAWFVHEGSVYDATPFLEEHPGGRLVGWWLVGRLGVGVGRCCGPRLACSHVHAHRLHISRAPSGICAWSEPAPLDCFAPCLTVCPMSD